MKKILTDCVSSTTAHGLPHLGNNKNNLVTKVAWTFIVLSAFGVFTFHSTCLLIKYFRHETSVSVQLEGTEFIVPDIYVCNRIPISRLLMNYKLKNKDADYLKMANLIKGNRSILIHIYQNRHLPNFSRDFFQRLWSNRNYTDFIQPYITRHLRAEEIFEQVPHFVNEICYKLKEKYKYLITNKTPLQLTLYSDAHWFTSLNKPAIPFLYPIPMRPLGLLPPAEPSSHMVYLAVPGFSPYLECLNVYAEKGVLTSIDITMEHHKRVNRPTLPCIENFNVSMAFHNIFNHSNPLRYLITKGDCETLHKQENAAKVHKCVAPTVPFTHKQWEKVDSKYCDKGIDFLQHKLDNRTREHCNKQIPCHLPVYNAVVTKYQIRRDAMQSEVIYANKYYSHLYSDLEKSFFNKQNLSFEEHIKLYDEVQESFTKIEIYASKRYSTVYKEIFNYEPRSLLSDIGGILGFYMGISFVTIFEFLGFTIKYMTR